MLDAPSQCPCGTKLPFASCCQPLLTGAPAPTAEALMRSRFSAFATGNVEYLVRTHAKEISRNERDEIGAWCKATRWISLTITKTEKGQANDLEGWVEFRALFLEDREFWVMEERSRFEKRDGRWIYIDGMGRRQREAKPGRNELCPCGSGQRFKRCHGG